VFPIGTKASEKFGATHLGLHIYPVDSIGGFVKIAVISDIHANHAALDAFPEKEYDQLWCLGDLLDYGPKPREVIRWIRKKAAITVRGNHDHAVGFDVDPQCSLPFKNLAAETREFTQRVCAPDEIDYLRNLPIQQEVDIDGTSFYLVHAIPTDPLFGYCPEDSEKWEKELDWVRADVLVVGHTHTPFIRRIGNKMIVNPGSLGQPKTGRTLACYAVWEDGEILLKEYQYRLSDTIEEIHTIPVSQDVQDRLIAVLKSGGTLSTREYAGATASHF
jgi:putative phosphoesterase